MRDVLLVLLVGAASCAGPPRLSEDARRADAILRRGVPIERATLDAYDLAMYLREVRVYLHPLVHLRCPIRKLGNLEYEGTELIGRAPPQARIVKADFHLYGVTRHYLPCPGWPRSLPGHIHDILHNKPFPCHDYHFTRTYL